MSSQPPENEPSPRLAIKQIVDAALAKSPPSASTPHVPVPAPAADDPPSHGFGEAGDAELAALRDDPEMAELFVAEALDHLSTIEGALLALEQRHGDTTLLNDIFRPFHTIKGNAGALGLTSLEAVAHRVESLLDIARSGRRSLGPSDVDIVLRSVDVLTLMIRNVAARLSGQPAQPMGTRAADLMAHVEQAIAGTPQDAAGGAPSRWSDSVAREAAATPSAGTEGLQSIKVDTRKLDNLVDMIGELIVVQSLIQEDPAVSHLLDGRLVRNLGQLKRITGELHRHSMALRMVPIRQAFQKVSRVVRDLSRRAGKPVDLQLAGDDTELDRKIVEDITDPLMHMARNSLDHGIEPLAERMRIGKNERATLTLKAAHQGSQIVIQIADDGAGLDTDKILARARDRGLVAPDARPTPEAVHKLIYEPGFSTADAVTERSGRGVGMDVVRRNIEELRGRIAIATSPGLGTVFTITIPLTLAVLDGLIVAVGGERLVLPATAVRESIKPTAEQLHTLRGEARMIKVRDAVLPLFTLADLLGIRGAVTDLAEATVVVLESDGGRVGVLVDALVSKQEVVVKSLGDVFSDVRGVAGGAILGDGRIGLIIDAHAVLELAGGGSRMAA
jgi:two-component system chemotaxis sensor kinase CheA